VGAGSSAHGAGSYAKELSGPDHQGGEGGQSFLEEKVEREERTTPKIGARAGRDPFLY